MIKWIRALSCAVLLFSMSASAWAGEVRHDSYSITVDPAGGFAGGLGTGYDGGHWYQYDSGWINQWFWNDPFAWSGKWIEFKLFVRPVDLGAAGLVDIAINWSTPEWSLTGNPPTGPRLPPLPPTDESLYIFRSTVADHLIVPFDGILLSGRIDISGYNPEWVSVDVRGRNFQIAGTIDHQCIPLPSAAWSGISLFGVLLLRRRK